jgi:hypothetical protein
MIDPSVIVGGARSFKDEAHFSRALNNCVWNIIPPPQTGCSFYDISSFLIIRFRTEVYILIRIAIGFWKRHRLCRR